MGILSVFLVTNVTHWNFEMAACFLNETWSPSPAHPCPAVRSSTHRFVIVGLPEDGTLVSDSMVFLWALACVCWRSANVGMFTSEELCKLVRDGAVCCTPWFVACEWWATFPGLLTMGFHDGACGWICYCWSVVCEHRTAHAGLLL